MKKLTNLILCLVASVAFFSSCTDFSDDIKKLQEQIDALKSEQIKSIDEQVVSIKSSLSGLQLTDKELQTYIGGLQSQLETLEQTEKDVLERIENLQKETEDDNKESLAQMEELKAFLADQVASLKSTIEALQAKDNELKAQIDKLQTYIDSGIKNSKDWVSATFATLEQYNTTASIIATIQAQIETINSDISILKNISDKISKEDLDKAISSSESAIKDWVNSLLEGYYTAEQVDAKLASLKKEFDRSGSEDVESLVKDYEDKLAKTKTEIAEAYTSAITKAINDYNGTITSRIASEISTVNGKISSLRADITDLEERVSNIESQLSELYALVNDLINSGNNRRISGETTVIDGITWMNYNVGADKSNLLGDVFTFEEAQTACPDGYRLPTLDEAIALSAGAYSNSEWTTYNGTDGIWFSGSLGYSATSPAIFLPGMQNPTSAGLYWTLTQSVYEWFSEGYDSSGTYIWYPFFPDSYSFGWDDNLSNERSVRCVKDDRTIRTIVGETTEIDGVTWMNYNSFPYFGGSDFFTSFYESQIACPEGYRVPSIDELSSLRTNSSGLTTYLGSYGYWFSGKQPYSETVPAIFLTKDFIPCYWSSTECDGESYYALGHNLEDGLYKAGRDRALWVRCVKDSNPRLIKGETVEIDGITWMNYNVGADESNLIGDSFTFNDAQTVCPDGYRVPTRIELKSLTSHYSPATRFNGTVGRWFSGRQEYSENVPAVFLPHTNVDDGYYWSSSKTDEYCGKLLRSTLSSVSMEDELKDVRYSVRCVKDYEEEVEETEDGELWRATGCVDDGSGNEWKAILVALEDNNYSLKRWYGVHGYNLNFSVNEDSSITITNATSSGDYEFYVPANAGKNIALYTGVNNGYMYSYFRGNKDSGELLVYNYETLSMYKFAWPLD